MSFKYALCLTASLALLPMTALAQTATQPAAASAPAASADKNAPVTHAEFESLLKDTLMNNPDILMDTIKRLHDKHMEESNKQMQDSLAKHMDELVHDTKSPTVGPKDADVTIIEFFDYHCGYCKHMLPVVTEVLHNDPKVRFIFREFPILSEDSVTASRAAVAVYRIDPDKYFDFYTTLLQSSGKFDKESLSKAAKKVGVSPSKMEKEMESPDITNLLDSTRALAEDMGIRGTPAFIVGDQILPGAVPYEELSKAIDDTRKGIKHKPSDAAAHQ